MPSPRKERTYNLRLSERQLWHLMNSFQASFTDPDSMNKHEVAVNNKLNRLHQKAHQDKRRDVLAQAGDNVPG